MKHYNKTVGNELLARAVALDLSRNKIPFVCSSSVTYSKKDLGWKSEFSVRIEDRHRLNMSIHYKTRELKKNTPVRKSPFTNIGFEAISQDHPDIPEMNEDSPTDN